jgi:outer membrane protein OmpA-like peptidoglycan-associated protein
LVGGCEADEAVTSQRGWRSSPKALKPSIPGLTWLAELAIILNKYADTHILLAGHTDSTGSAEHNLALSRRRAASVSSFLATQNVPPVRITAYGYGQDHPVASNETEAGRAQNRRVEVAIWANDKLKKAAAQKASR